MHNNKKTKIVATIGPVTESQEMLEKLLKAGLNIVRMNFSHGDFAEHQKKIDNGRAAAKKLGMPLSFMQDLCGPKIRTGEFATDTGRVTLKKGQTFTFVSEKVPGDDTRVYVSYPLLAKEIQVGSFILLDDGKKKFEVTAIKGNDVVTKVIVGGELKSRRTVNLPGTRLSISSLTAKDKKDLEFGIKNQVDFVALSFVRNAAHVNELRKLMNKKGLFAKIISKVETPDGVENIDEIIEASDGIMVARGDLAVETPAENVPLMQKMIIEKCNRAGKPVITATQMLESMIKAPVPTRAEVSDVANAILDGTDAIMLSEESTLGEYPIECVETMTRIALRVENDWLHEKLLPAGDRIDVENIGESMAASAVMTAHVVGAKYIVAMTELGYAAAMTSRHRPHMPVIAFTPDAKTYGHLNMFFGVWPVMMPRYKSFDEAIKVVRDTLRQKKLVKAGDRVIVISGTPFGASKDKDTNVVVVDTF